MRFDSPVGTDTERADGKLWPGAWYDATGFATLYGATGRQSYHTGADLNLSADRDASQPVCCVADGLCVFSGNLWAWGWVIVSMHTLEDGRSVWIRYAHLESPTVRFGDALHRGQPMAAIGQYSSSATRNHHLHFDVSTIDLGAKPGDWPGMALERLKSSYLPPLEFLRSMQA